MGMENYDLVPKFFNFVCLITIVLGSYILVLNFIFLHLSLWMS
jgi:hypothetical protein